MAAEATHFEKNPTAAKSTDKVSASKRQIEEGPGLDEEEDIEAKKRRVIEETRAVDAASDTESEDSESDSEDSEDETAELLRELEKIKQERAEKKAQEDTERAAQDQEQRESDIAYGNPLLNPNKSADTNKRWDDDVVFRNQARGTEKKGKPEFVNDLLRSDFHKRFMVGIEFWIFIDATLIIADEICQVEGRSRQLNVYRRHGRISRTSAIVHLWRSITVLRDSRQDTIQQARDRPRQQPRHHDARAG